MEHLLLICCCLIYNMVLFKQKKTPFSWVYSKKKLKQFCAVNSGRKKAK